MEIDLVGGTPEALVPAGAGGHAREWVVEFGAEVTAVEELAEVVRWCDLHDPWGNRLGSFQDLARC